MPKWNYGQQFQLHLKLNWMDYHVFFLFVLIILVLLSQINIDWRKEMQTLAISSWRRFFSWPPDKKPPSMIRTTRLPANDKVKRTMSDINHPPSFLNFFVLITRENIVLQNITHNLNLNRCVFTISHHVAVIKEN